MSFSAKSALHFSDDIGVAGHFEIRRDDCLGIGFCRLSGGQTQPRPPIIRKGGYESGDPES
jgi:hypothetical protein